jgi:hypothetical protein
MTISRFVVEGVACATLLWAGMALATPTPQENCANARITAWKTYVSCVDRVVAKDASCDPTASCPVTFDESAAFAKCRHTYFKNWTAFQTKMSLATSTCQPGGGARFVDNGDGTVTDNLSMLVWEKKDNLDGSVNFADPHDADNSYTWSTGAPWAENGTAFTSFLTDATTGLNVTGFAGANGWRLPTLAELQTILADFPCTGALSSPTCSCGSSPCIDGTFGPTARYSFYWSATSWVPGANIAWLVYFLDGAVQGPSRFFGGSKTVNFDVRAVRGGL